MRWFTRKPKDPRSRTASYRAPPVTCPWVESMMMDVDASDERTHKLRYLSVLLRLLLDPCRSQLRHNHPHSEQGLHIIRGRSRSTSIYTCSSRTDHTYTHPAYCTRHPKEGMDERTNEQRMSAPHTTPKPSTVLAMGGVLIGASAHTHGANHAARVSRSRLLVRPLTLPAKAATAGRCAVHR